jgi:hypothetical protein
LLDPEARERLQQQVLKDVEALKKRAKNANGSVQGGNERKGQHLKEVDDGFKQDKDAFDKKVADRLKEVMEEEKREREKSKDTKKDAQEVKNKEPAPPKGESKKEEEKSANHEEKKEDEEPQLNGSANEAGDATPAGAQQEQNGTGLFGLSSTDPKEEGTSYADKMKE